MANGGSVETRGTMSAFGSPFFQAASPPNILSDTRPQPSPTPTMDRPTLGDAEAWQSCSQKKESSSLELTAGEIFTV
ncbi:hypothetical protein E4U21_005515 [Claviceps maximensis]|nr:hypothetical protein E4U21_005515 [Claviceps maximensis]